MSVLAYIGLGSNLGDRVQNIIEARSRLVSFEGIENSRCSALYLTSPVGYAQQSDFVNCVLELQTMMSPTHLFEHMQGVEEVMGRVRVEHNQNAARVIDCDLLLFSDMKIETDNLTVPHPRIQQRLFVLEPLLELVADIQIGELGLASVIIESGNKKNLFADQEVYRMGSQKNTIKDVKASN